MNHYLIFALGAIVGANIGFILLAIVKAGSDADDLAQKGTGR